MMQAQIGRGRGALKLRFTAQGEEGEAVWKSPVCLPIFRGVVGGGDSLLGGRPQDPLPGSKFVRGRDRFQLEARGTCSIQCWSPYAAWCSFCSCIARKL